MDEVTTRDSEAGAVPAIRAITFDFWGTLYKNKSVPRENKRTSLRIERLRGYLRNTSYDLSREAIEESFHNSYKMFADLLAQGEVMHAEGMVMAMGDELGLEFDTDQIGEMMTILEQVAVDIPPTTTKNAVDAIMGLSRRYKLAVISDTTLTPGRVLRQVLANDSIADCFESFSFSDEALYRKPHPEQFIQVLDDLGVNPEEAVHVGDLVETDIRGAKAVGMKTILFAENGAA
ncbi:unnamed protein product, partial [marine sediment metagenome]